MKAFRVITVFKSKAHLSIMVGNTKEEVREQITEIEEIIEIKEITDNLKLDICEVKEALRYFDVNELTQLLVTAILEEYDNVI